MENKKSPPTNNNGRRIIKARRPKPCSAATLRDSLKPKIELDEASASVAAIALTDSKTKTETPIGDDYTPKPSTVGLVDSQSISSVWSSILKNLETLDHPLPRNVAPATEEELLAAEKRMGYPMPLPLKEFYSLTNGIKKQMRWDVYIPYKGYIPSIDYFSHKDAFVTDFKSSLQMWDFESMCMDNFSGGLLYQWDSSFDGLYDNVIIANSLAEHLQRWDDELGKRIQSVVATRDVLLSALSSAKKPQRFPRLSNDLAFKIALYAAPHKLIETFQYEELVPINESVPHRFWFQKFKTEYERQFTKWPQYYDV